MPLFTFHTNLPKTQIPEEFCSKMTQVLAETLGKPAAQCTIHIIPDQIMTNAGSSEPCAHGLVMSIGKLGIEENKKHTSALMTELNKLLGIEPTRMFIRFVDTKPEDIGYNLTTFHGIM